MEEPGELLLIGEIDGKQVGNCSVMSMGSFKRYAHRCEIAVALYQEYCGAGIGKMMMETALQEAKKMGYEQAELEVVSDNANAIALYEKMGFKKYGTFPNSVKSVSYTHLDVYKRQGVFVALGTAGSGELARQIGAGLTEKGNIQVNSLMETTVPGLFAAGDCTGGLLQIAKAVYEGAQAGICLLYTSRIYSHECSGRAGR